MRLLLQAGADKEQPNSFGQTPLWIAAYEGHAGVVALLLEAGADKDRVDLVLGDTPLDRAVEKLGPFQKMVLACLEAESTLVLRKMADI